jgi:DNA-binding transcriptional MocR family regulator
MTPQQLFDYASAFPETPGRQYPTVREAALHFGVTQQDVVNACEDWHGDGYMKPATGFKTGSGIGTYTRRGDWLVEAYQ